MTYLEYDSGAAALVRALEDAARVPNEGGTAPHQLPLDRAAVALMRVHAPDAVLPELLRSESIWSSGSRDQIVIHVDGGPERFITNAGYLNLWDTIEYARQLAEMDKAPAVTEWHIVRALLGRRSDQLGLLQIHVDALKQRLEERLDIAPPKADERARTWCFCDMSFFLEGKYFTKVPWHKTLGFKQVVLVVAPAVMDELDDWRSNERRARHQKRARSVVRHMDQLTTGRPHGVPVPTETAPVELLRIGWEPRVIPLGLTRTLADDRLVASALDYRWRRPGIDVQVLTADRGLYEKARRINLQAVYLPENLRRDPNEHGASSDA